MGTYILRRLLLLLPVLLGLSIVVFIVMRSLPGDPAAALLGPDAKPQDIKALHQALKLDEPLPVQYGTWLTNVVRGDFGKSYTLHSPVGREVWKETSGALTNTIDVYINALRRKVQQPEKRQLIHTVRGVGYAVRDGT